MQCAATAATTVGAATGIRAWLAGRGLLRTPSRARAATAVLLTLGVIAAGVAISP